MKILLIYPVGKYKNPYSIDDKEYDFDSTYSLIKSNLLHDNPDISIDTLTELVLSNSYNESLKKSDYDVYLCDTTTYNGNYLYIAGLLDGLNKPVIFCSYIDHPPLPVTMGKLSLYYSESTLNNEFRESLNKVVSNFLINKSNSIQYEFKKQASKAFISYSHVDFEYLNRLMVHLKPLEVHNLIDIWQDTRLKAGDRWSEEISNALDNATIAILLISADFLASDFIVNNELPSILKKAQVNGTKILPVIVSPCRFLREKEMCQFHAINDPNIPLSLLSINEREVYYDKLASEIEKSLNLTKT
ncbi:toll/interleukin-1 receptor domain-containing protein [Shewanella cyperi]|uniref:Toll/interleukin-1 receptor domain-containing protein n=1 Tax=Shewanella cyperi TaxID=2814292 RepID=A0A974XNS5_9GAMM|nr:toll/interleukin-1 receptor domain-containing protein [Shewanella cyperi]QSX30658.1 toll/interleukin-1 receptor domain-containing protein [Shewanella cyperi]